MGLNVFYVFYWLWEAVTMQLETNVFTVWLGHVAGPLRSSYNSVTHNKIGHVRSGQAITLMSIGSGWEERRKLDKQTDKKIDHTRCCGSILHAVLLFCVFLCTNLLCRKQHAQFWFVFSCPGQETNTLWLHFSDSMYERDSLETVQCNYAKKKICRAKHCSHLGGENSSSLVELSCIFLRMKGLKSCRKASCLVF